MIEKVEQNRNVEREEREGMLAPASHYMLRFIMSGSSNQPLLYLLWDQITFDSAPWDPNRKMEFFVDPSCSSPERVTSLDEKTLVRWLMGCKPVRAFILPKLDRQNSAFSAAELIEPFYAKGEGDVDLLLCDRLDPGAAAAFECKRIKVEEIDQINDRMNKLGGLTNAIRQANRLYEKCGFFESYLALLVAVDSSKQSDSNIPCRGLRPNSTPDFGDHKTQRRILEFPGRENLRPEVGIIFVEVVQPSGKSINEMATVRVLRFHPATPRFQSAQTTRHLSMLIENAGRGEAVGSDSAEWEAAPQGAVELRIGGGAAIGKSSSGLGPAAESARTFFNLRGWKAVIKRNLH